VFGNISKGAEVEDRIKDLLGKGIEIEFRHPQNRNWG